MRISAGVLDGCTVPRRLRFLRLPLGSRVTILRGDREKLSRAGISIRAE